MTLPATPSLKTLTSQGLQSSDWVNQQYSATKEQNAATQSFQNDIMKQLSTLQQQQQDVQEKLQRGVGYIDTNFQKIYNYLQKVRDLQLKDLADVSLNDALNDKDLFSFDASVGRWRSVAIQVVSTYLDSLVHVWLANNIFNGTTAFNNPVTFNLLATAIFRDIVTFAAAVDFNTLAPVTFDALATFNATALCNSTLNTKASLLFENLATSDPGGGLVWNNGHLLTIGSAPSSPVTRGTYTVTGTGFSSGDPTGTARWVKNDTMVMLFLPTLSGTSNSVNFTLTGSMPASIQPARTVYIPVHAEDNTHLVVGLAQLSASSSTINLYPPNDSQHWDDTGSTKALFAACLAYTLE